MVTKRFEIHDTLVPPKSRIEGRVDRSESRSELATLSGKAYGIGIRGRYIVVTEYTIPALAADCSRLDASLPEPPPPPDPTPPPPPDNPPPENFCLEPGYIWYESEGVCGAVN